MKNKNFHFNTFLPFHYVCQWNFFSGCRLLLLTVCRRCLRRFMRRFNRFAEIRPSKAASVFEYAWNHRILTIMWLLHFVRHTLNGMTEKSSTLWYDWIEHCKRSYYICIRASHDHHRTHFAHSHHQILLHDIHFEWSVWVRKQFSSQRPQHTLFLRRDFCSSNTVHCGTL